MMVGGGGEAITNIVISSIKFPYTILSYSNESCSRALNCTYNYIVATEHRLRSSCEAGSAVRMAVDVITIIVAELC